MDEILYTRTSVLHALDFLNQFNGPGRIHEAIRMLRHAPNGQWVPKGHIAIPTTRAEAEMMHLLADNWLKHHSSAGGERPFTPRSKEDEIKEMKQRMGDEPNA